MGMLAVACFNHSLLGFLFHIFAQLLTDLCLNTLNWNAESESSNDSIYCPRDISCTWHPSQAGRQTLLLRTRERAEMSVSVYVVALDICLYFPLQQSELLVTLCNEDVGHHFGPWLIKKLDTYARPPSDVTAHLMSIRGRPVPEAMTEMLVLQLFL